MAPAELVERALDAGLDRVAVTDHNGLDGALEARARFPDRVIVGEEIDCRGGTDLIGLFLTERIPPGLDIEEVAERIRGQGGVVYAPHPFAYPARAGWHAARALAVADVVEVFNSRAFLPAWNRNAARAARRRGLPAAASSDAHFAGEVGRAWTELPAFAGAAEFLAAMRHATPVAVATGSPLLHVASLGLKAVRLAGARLGLDRPAAGEPETVPGG